MNNNLTLKKDFYKYLHNGEYNVADLEGHTYVIEGGEIVSNIHINETKHYLIGPVVDRLAEFESIGMEPDEIRKMIEMRDIDKLASISRAKHKLNCAISELNDAYEAAIKACKR